MQCSLLGSLKGFDRTELPVHVLTRASKKPTWRNFFPQEEMQLRNFPGSEIWDGRDLALFIHYAPCSVFHAEVRGLLIRSRLESNRMFIYLTLLRNKYCINW